MTPSAPKAGCSSMDPGVRLVSCSQGCRASADVGWIRGSGSWVALSKQMLLSACARLFTLLPELLGTRLSTEVPLKLVSDLSGCVQRLG